jgi:hypothetical protein
MWLAGYEGKSFCHGLSPMEITPGDPKLFRVLGIGFGLWI